MFVVLKLNHKILIVTALLLVFVGVFSVINGLASASHQERHEGIKVVIMMYHEVKPTNSGKLSITPWEFESDLKYIEQNGYTTINMSDLIDYVEGKGELPEKPIILTFDDGYQSNYTYAYPILKKYNMKAVISIIGSDADECTADKEQNIDIGQISWDEVNEMISSNCVEFQNHTYDLHSNSAGRVGTKRKYGESLEHYEAVLSDDLNKCQQDFKDKTGFIPNTFTYPYGEISPESVPIIKNLGFKATLSCDEGVNYITNDPDALFGLKRIPRFHGTTLQNSIKLWDK
jgi:peptidoglycan/xylan/chitin deacetylase (PgdA/CDA1 family)